jgi:hypothetical protein
LTVLGKVFPINKKAKSKPGLILQASSQQYETYHSLSDAPSRTEKSFCCFGKGDRAKLSVLSRIRQQLFDGIAYGA